MSSETTTKARGGARPYQVGRAFEYLVAQKLRAQGWYVVRSYKSRTLVDLTAISRVSQGEEKSMILFIQAKKDGRLPGREREGLVALAEAHGAIPVLVEGVRPVRFWKLGKSKERETMQLVSSQGPDATSSADHPEVR